MVRTILFLSVLIAACLFLTSCPLPTPTPASTFQDSLRMGTFNVQFLPGSDDDTTRSKRIADRIKAGRYDIIALNEVFDEEARDTFVAELSGTYPNYVAYIGDPAVGAEDSGLMLFSRYEFEPLPVPTHLHDPSYLVARNAGADWKDVAFIEYDADIFPDNWAGKGAAFVRINNPHTNRIINVAFTHMQASYPQDEDDCDDYWGPTGVRWAQMYDIRKVITGSLTAGQLLREDIFVMGDLNIDGDLADPNLGMMGCDQPNLWEWARYFTPPGAWSGFFSDTFRDCWAFEHSPDDRGLTNMYHWGPEYAPDQGARLDYILRNRPTTANRALCIQHLTLAHNMRDGAPWIESGFGQAGINELSDHIGVNADVNQWAPHCNPTEAYMPPLETYVSGTITYPGSMQWHRFDTPGTYAFHVTGSGIRYRVYESRDLSTPAVQYYCETATFIPVDGKPVTGEKYHLPEAPFYVRVFHQHRTQTGSYQFVAHMNSCASQSDAGVLRANDPVVHTLPPSPINADDTAWFEFRTQVADSGVAQDLSCVVDQFSPGTFDLELRRGDGATVVASQKDSEPDPDNPGGQRLVIKRNDLGTSLEKFYLLVKRTDLSALSFRIRWETNLTIMHGQGAGIPGSGSENLYCVEETDTIGIDEVFLTVVVDGITKVNDVYIGEYDDGVYRTMEDLIGTVRFLNNVAVTLREEDGGANGEDDYLSTTIGILAPNETQKLNITSTLSSAGGTYLLRYNLSRSLQQ